MKTISLLADWRRTSITIKASAHKELIGIQLEIFVSPAHKFYRRAASWENPDLLVTTGIWSPEMDIRLMRVRDKVWKRLIRRTLEKR